MWQLRRTSDRSHEMTVCLSARGYQLIVPKVDQNYDTSYELIRLIHVTNGAL